MYTGIGAQSDALQDPPYLEHYGLVRDPFSLAIENDFFYDDPSRSQNLDLLHHVTLSNELLMLVSGTHGIGKSSLLHRFIAKANDTWKICLINANSMLFEEQFMRQVFRGFGQAVPTEGGTNEHLKKLADQLEDIQRQGETALLIIDDAHELPTPTLQFLSRLHGETHDANKSLRIIMFAEQQIENILPSAGPLKQAITHTLELAPLSEKETAEYIKHRMMVAGFNSNTPSLFAYPFTDAVIAKIYKSSHGLPSQINKHAGQILLDMSRGVKQEEKPATPATKETTGRKLSSFTVLAAILVAVALIAILAIQDTINEFFTPSLRTGDTIAMNGASNADAAKPGVIQRMRREPVMALQEEEDTQETTVNETDGVPGDSAITVGQSPTVAPSESEMMAKSATVQDTDPVVAAQDTPSVQTQSVDSETTPATKTRIEKNNEAVAKDTLQQALADEQATKTGPGTAEKTGSAEIIQASKQSSAELLEKQTATPDATPITNDVVSKQMSWLYEQNPWHYTLQLLSTHNLKTIDKFVAANKLEDKAVTLKSRRKDKNWYLLLYGAYPDAGIAKKSSALLEKKKNFAGIKPWLRPFAILQTNLLGKKITPPKKITTAKPTRPAAKKAGTKTVTKKPAAKPSAEHWLLAQNPWAYTIQLIGSKNHQSISNYIKHHRLDRSKAIFFRTRRDHDDWYILVYGIYPSKKDARDAINKLPAKLRQSSPWLRPVASVHSAIISAAPATR